MTLRTKLILAFLLLAVLPLVAVTVWSYASSIEAMHRTVERESGAVAEEMGRRMERVAEDLDRGVGGLGNLPFQSLMASDGSDSMAAPAGEFVADLYEQMGDSALLVDALEFIPAEAMPAALALVTDLAPVAPLAPGRPRPHAAPEASPVLIHLSRKLFEQQRIEQIEARGESAGFVRGKGGLMLLPREQIEHRIKITVEGDEEVGALVESLVAIGESEARDWQEFAAAVEEKAKVFAERQETRAARDTAGQKKTWKLKRDFDCAVERDGEVVGTVKARVNAQHALETVLGRVEYGEGEIPFAVDDRGGVYTLDPEDEQTLDGLQLAELASTGSAEGNTSIKGDWVLVTREAPALGLTFGMARPVGESLAEIRRVTGRNFGWGIGMIAVAMLGIVPLSGRMTRNLSELNTGAARLAAGDLRTHVPVRSRDEIGRLAQSFNRMTDDLRHNQEQLVVKERLSKELEMCRQIQVELLPHTTSSFPFAEVRGVSIPAREVGGDFFNYFPLPGGDVAIVMGDVSGKGVPAALLMANLQATLRARMPHERELAELARRLDAEIEQNTRAESYVTLFVGVIDHQRLTLTYVNAGHNPQYLVRSGGGVEKLGACGRPLGLLPGGDYEARRLELSSDDLLFLFTDGLVEAENPGGEEFGARRLEQLLVEARTDGPERLLARVESSCGTHRCGTDATDDATMLALKIAGPAH